MRMERASAVLGTGRWAMRSLTARFLTVSLSAARSNIQMAQDVRSTEARLKKKDKHERTQRTCKPSV